MMNCALFCEVVRSRVYCVELARFAIHQVNGLPTTCARLLGRAPAVPDVGLNTDFVLVV